MISDTRDIHSKDSDSLMPTTPNASTVESSNELKLRLRHQTVSNREVSGATGNKFNQDMGRARNHIMHVEHTALSSCKQMQQLNEL